MNFDFCDTVVETTKGFTGAGIGGYGPLQYFNAKADCISTS